MIWDTQFYLGIQHFESLDWGRLEYKLITFPYKFIDSIRFSSIPKDLINLTQSQNDRKATEQLIKSCQFFLLNYQRFQAKNKTRNFRHYQTFQKHLEILDCHITTKLILILFSHWFLAIRKVGIEMWESWFIYFQFGLKDAKVEL